MEQSRTVLLVDKVYEEIKKRILNGEYLPGIHLVESELTEVFNVSRVTIRDALRKLVVDELVDFIPNSGIKVRRLSYKDVIDLYVVREPIEALAARLAVHAPPKKLKELQKICSESKIVVSELDRIKHRELNMKFHRMLAEVTGNRTLVKILERLHTQVVAHQFLPFMRDADLIESQHSHEDIVAAILAGDADKAELEMRRHIKRGRDFILSCFPESQKNN